MSPQLFRERVNDRLESSKIGIALKWTMLRQQLTKADAKHQDTVTALISSLCERVWKGSHMNSFLATLRKERCESEDDENKPMNETSRSRRRCTKEIFCVGNIVSELILPFSGRCGNTGVSFQLYRGQFQPAIGITILTNFDAPLFLPNAS